MCELCERCLEEIDPTADDYCEDCGELCHRCHTEDEAREHRRVPTGTLLGNVINFLRKEFLNNGAEGESIHKLCDLAEGLHFRLKSIKEVVDEQAEDTRLWFKSRYITEDTLQKELRRLHGAIEDEDVGLITGKEPEVNNVTTPSSS